MLKKIARAVIESSFAYGWFGQYPWYRRLHGGRWERWAIDICQANIWLRIPEHWPDNHRQACSIGPRLAREDYPL
jgi:hypothetical protein